MIDASVIAPLLLPDEPILAEDVAEAIVTGPLLAPRHWPFEVMNMLHVAERRRRINRSGRQNAIDLARRLPVVVRVDTGEAVWTDTSRLADIHELTIYDAAYLELAIRLRASLATRDGDLADAARAENVPVLG